MNRLQDKFALSSQPRIVLGLHQTGKKHLFLSRLQHYSKWTLVAI